MGRVGMISRASGETGVFRYGRSQGAANGLGIYGFIEGGFRKTDGKVLIGGEKWPS
jgi:hypothetical protein